MAQGARTAAREEAGEGVGGGRTCILRLPESESLPPFSPREGLLPRAWPWGWTQAGFFQDAAWDNIPCGLPPPCHPRYPGPLPEAKTGKEQPPHTSKSSCLQLLVPDDGWGDPHIFSNFLNLLDMFMEKTTTRRHVRTAEVKERPRV